MTTTALRLDAEGPQPGRAVAVDDDRRRRGVVEQRPHLTLGKGRIEAGERPAGAQHRELRGHEPRRVARQHDRDQLVGNGQRRQAPAHRLGHAIEGGIGHRRPRGTPRARRNVEGQGIGPAPDRPIEEDVQQRRQIRGSLAAAVAVTRAPGCGRRPHPSPGVVRRASGAQPE